jgi:hypothetical protein
MRLADAVTSSWGTRAAIDASGATIAGGVVSEENSDSKSWLSVPAAAALLRNLVEPERMSQESGRPAKGIVAPALSKSETDLTLTPTSQSVKVRKGGRGEKGFARPP